MCDASSIIVGARRVGTPDKQRSKRCILVLVLVIEILSSHADATYDHRRFPFSVNDRVSTLRRNIEQVMMTQPSTWQQSTLERHALVSPQVPSVSPGSFASSQRSPIMPHMQSSTSTPTAMIFFPTNLIVSPSLPLASDAPSLKPSPIPSSLRTSFSFVSDLPSSSPSLTHSRIHMTKMGSDSPSLSPSRGLSTSHLNHRSDVPSLSPSHRPSNHALNMAAADHPSTYPSDFPSINPSLGPSPLLSSDVPSIVPSSLPSFKRASSEFPSTSPSILPTIRPSWSPTNLPSGLPSLFASDSPSSAPSQLCHDDHSYQSPINNLTCGDFRGTDCTQWRFIGLTIDEVQVLVNSCPISCNITCGTFTQFRVRIAYHISNVPGLMSFDSVNALQQVSETFLSGYGQSNLPSSHTFVVLNVELASQAILSASDYAQNRGLRLRSHRKLQSLSNVTLDVSVIFSGFAIGLSNDAITEQLVSGIDDPKYTSSIQRSGDPFLQSAEASSAILTGQPAPPTSVNTRGGGPSKSLVAAVTVAALIGVVAFGITAYVYRRRSGHWVPDNLQKRDAPKPSNRFSSYPPQSFDDGSYLQAELASLSFTSAQSGRGLLGVVTSNSKDSTSPSSDSNQSSEAETDMTIPVDIADGILELNDEKTEEILEEHPLDGVIPPMVVYDNIDDQEEGACHNGVSQTDWQERDGLGVPIRHIVASSGLLAALNDNDKPLTPTSLAKMMYKEAPGLYRPPEATQSQLGAMDSPISTEVYSTDDSSDDSSETTEVALSPGSTSDASSLPKCVDELLPVPQGIGLRRSFRRSTSDFVISSPQNTNSYLCEEDRNVGSSQMPLDQIPLLQNISGFTHRHSDSLPDISLAEIKMARRGNERASRRSLPGSATESMLRHTLWSLSPLRKPATEPTQDTEANAKNSLLLPSLDMPSHCKDFKEGSEFSITAEEWPVLPFLNNRGSLDSIHEVESNRSPELGFTFEVTAPRNQKLGLLIESALNEGPVIHEVKEHSPLCGLVHQGDRIISVDGTDTTNMSLFAVTSLLSEKRQWQGDHLMRIVVVRPTNDDDEEMENSVREAVSGSPGPFLRSDYDGGSSLTSNDPIDSLEEEETYDAIDSLLEQQQQQQSRTTSTQAFGYHNAFLPYEDDMGLALSTLDQVKEGEEEGDPERHEINSSDASSTFRAPATDSYDSESLQPIRPSKQLFRQPTLLEPHTVELQHDPSELWASIQPIEDSTASQTTAERPYPPYSLGLETTESMISYGTTNDSEASPIKEKSANAATFIDFHSFGIDHTTSVMDNHELGRQSEPQPPQQVSAFVDMHSLLSSRGDQAEWTASYDTLSVLDEEPPLSGDDDTW